MKLTFTKLIFFLASYNMSLAIKGTPIPKMDTKLTALVMLSNPKLICSSLPIFSKYNSKFDAIAMIGTQVA